MDSGVTNRALHLRIETDDDFGIDDDWSGTVVVIVPMLPGENAIDTYARWLQTVKIEGKDGAADWLATLLDPEEYWSPYCPDNDWGPTTSYLDIPGGDWSLSGFVYYPHKIKEELNVELLLKFLVSHGKTVKPEIAQTFIANLEEEEVN